MIWDEPSLKGMEAMYGLELEDREFYAREISHCHAVLAFRARGALSRHAPGRSFLCCSGMPCFERGHGRGYYK